MKRFVICERTLSLFRYVKCSFKKFKILIENKLQNKKFLLVVFFFIPLTVANKCSEYCLLCDNTYGCYECQKGYYPIENEFPVKCAACHESCYNSHPSIIDQDKMKNAIEKLIDENAK